MKRLQSRFTYLTYYDLVTLTFDLYEGVVVMYTHTELVIAEYGNKCLIRHNCIKCLTYFTKCDLVTLTFDV